MPNPDKNFTSTPKIVPVVASGNTCFLTIDCQYSDFLDFN